MLPDEDIEDSASQNSNNFENQNGKAKNKVMQ